MFHPFQLLARRAARKEAPLRAHHLHRSRPQHLGRLQPEVLQDAPEGHRLRQPVRDGELFLFLLQL